MKKESKILKYMKNKYVFVLFLLLSILVVSFGFTNIYVSQKQSVEEEDFVVVTSFYPMYIAAMNVIGDTDGVTLQNLSEPQTGCLHDFQLTPADMKLLSTADVFIINGGGIESFMEDIAKQYPDLVVIEACEGIELLCEESAHEHDVHTHEIEGEHVEEHETESGHVHETEDEHVEEHEEESGHIHDDEADHVAENETQGHDMDLEDTHDGHNHDVNAHAWMSVKNYRKQIENIADGLTQVFPDADESFRLNADVYDEKLQELQAEQEKLLILTKDKEVILFHCAYDYVAEDLGLEAAFCMDLDEERQVSAGEVAEVLHVIEAHDVKYIFAEELYGKSMCELVQKEADVKVIYLDPLNRGEYEADSYIEGMKENLKLIREML